MNTKVKINNWEKYKSKTKDLKNPWWFAFSNNFLEDPEMWALTDSEKIAWIYVLCQASKQKKACPFVNFEHAERSCNVEKSTLLDTIKKLESFGIVTVDRPESDDDPTMIRPRSDQHITLQDITKHNITKQNIAQPAQNEQIEHVSDSSWTAQKKKKATDEIYKLYPRKEGKARGMKKLKTIITSREKAVKVHNAVQNYARYHLELETETRYLKHFSTWITDWEDWDLTEYETDSKIKADKPLPRR